MLTKGIPWQFMMLPILTTMGGFILGLPALSIAAALMWMVIVSFACWKHKYYPGIPALTGAALNMTAVFANGGRMPVEGANFAMTAIHAPMTAHSHLKFLCDIFPLFHNNMIMSVGDIFLLVIYPLTAIAFWVYSKYINGKETKTTVQV